MALLGAAEQHIRNLREENEDNRVPGLEFGAEKKDGLCDNKGDEHHCHCMKI